MHPHRAYFTNIQNYLSLFLSPLENRKAVQVSSCFPALVTLIEKDFFVSLLLLIVLVSILVFLLRFWFGFS